MNTNQSNKMDLQRESENPLSIRDLLYVFFSRVRFIAALFVLTVSCMLLALSIWPESYEATAKILVMGSRTNVPASTQRYFKDKIRSEDINSEIELLNNPQIITQLVDEMGVRTLNPPPVKPDSWFGRIKYLIKQGLSRAMDTVDEILYKLNLKKRIPVKEQFVQEIIKRLSVDRVSSSDVISVSLLWGSPEISQNIMAKLISLYLKKHLEIRKGYNAQNIVSKQARKIEERLMKSEQIARNIKARLGIKSYDDRENFLNEKISALEDSLLNTNIDLSQIYGRLEGIHSILEQKNISRPENDQIERNDNLDVLRNNLIKKQQLQNILDIYPEELARLEIKKHELLAKKSKIEEYLNIFHKEAQNLSEHSPELNKLGRQIPVDEKALSDYKRAIEESRLNNLLDAGGVVNVRLISEPHASSSPVKPKKLLLLSVASAISLFMGFGLAFIMEYFDHIIRRKEHIEKYVNIPVIATIPKLK